MEKYKKIAYLLGCYMSVADKEINALEIEVLDNYLTNDEIEEIGIQKQMIFSDDDKKPKLSTLIAELTLANITYQQKQEIIKLLADVAYGDNYMARQEKQLLFEVVNALNVNASDIISESEIHSKERIESARLSKTKRTIGKVENSIFKLIKSNRKRDTIDLLLGSLGYSTSIEEITDTALVDLERVSKIVDDINEALISTNNSLNKLKISEQNSSKEVIEVAQTVTGVKDHFEKLIGVSLKENIETIDKKRRNIRYFTIAFMGRTKAGKSTLHKVITQQETDDVGIGKLRTTRYNRSWYWNKLRIVDTPGIGAPGGEADTEIAKSIIDEADVICYVVTSDSIQETEFDFFDTIKEHNKPLYIILNVKSNLTQSIRLKRFLEDPYSWKECTGPQSIKGHIDRIHERLNGKYNMDAVEIIPIHLLAAQLGFSEGVSNEDAEKLRKGSNIFSFTSSVKNTVRKTGELKKSLSVVDGTAYQIHQISLSLAKDLTQLKDGHDLLEKKLAKFHSFMNNEKTKLVEDLKNTFSGAKKELHRRAAAFADENYDRSDADKLWERDSTVEAIYSKLNTQLKQRIEDYNEKVKSQIEEIAEDIQVLGSFNAVSSVSGESITNTRLGIGIVGSILSAAVPIIVTNLWHPGGWVLASVTVAVGLVVSIFTSLFTSKADKIQKATKDMREQLISNINKSIEENEQSFLNDFTKSFNSTTSSISEQFLTYIRGTEQIIREVSTLYKKSEQGESAINSLVSFRILEFVGEKIAKDKDIKSLNNKDLTLLYPVKRDWVNQTITYLYKINLTKRKRQKINQATQMQILTESINYGTN